MSAARELAGFLATVPSAELPTKAVDYAAMLVASTLASAAMGSKISSAAIIHNLAIDRGGTPEASLWFTPGPKLPISDAARVNAVMSDAAASDDSDLRSIMHCGTPLIASTLAIGERDGSSGEEILAAIIVGYEAAGRMNDAIPRYRDRGFHGSALSIFAATVAAGRLLKLTPEKMTHAIALAATSAGGLAKSADASVAREYHAGQAVTNGIDAARAAQRGYTAEVAILEMPLGFFEVYGGDDGAMAAERALHDLGTSWDIETDMAIKLMPGGHPYHAMAEAAALAAREGSITPDEVESIVVSAPGLADLTGPRHPSDLIGMAHSPRYFIAAAVADRMFSWIHSSPAKLDNALIHRLVEKIEIGSPAVPNSERYRQGAMVTIRKSSGESVTRTVYAPKGAGFLGIDWFDVDAKYRALMPQSGLNAGRIERSLTLIHHLRLLDRVSPLLDLLSIKTTHAASGFA